MDQISCSWKVLGLFAVSSVPMNVFTHFKLRYKTAPNPSNSYAYYGSDVEIVTNVLFLIHLCSLIFAFSPFSSLPLVC